MPADGYTGCETLGIVLSPRANAEVASSKLATSARTS
jgi:hypothetical protein